jgi:hypothetical protein
VSATKFPRLNDERTKDLPWLESGVESGRRSKVGGDVRVERNAERERRRVEVGKNVRIADLEYQISQYKVDNEGLKKALKLARDEVKQKDEELKEHAAYLNSVKDRVLHVSGLARSRLPVNIDKLDHAERSAYCVAVGKVIQQEMLTNSRGEKTMKQEIKTSGEVISYTALLDEYEECRLGDATGQRKWMFAVSDVGATNVNDVDDANKTSGRYFFPIMPTGHEMFALEGGIMRVIFSTWGKCLSQLCGFTSPKALDFAKSAGSHHKTKEMLIDIFMPAMLAAFITEFAVHSDWEGDSHDDFLLRFEAWGQNEAETDAHFKEAWYIFTSLLPAYSLLCKGIASNNALAYRAARTFLYPLFCVNNNYNYARVSLRDMSLPHRYTSEMNEALNQLVSMHGQPVDFITENLVSKFNKNVGADSQAAYQRAQYITSKE